MSPDPVHLTAQLTRRAEMLHAKAAGMTRPYRVPVTPQALNSTADLLARAAERIAELEQRAAAGVAAEALLAVAEG